MAYIRDAAMESIESRADEMARLLEELVAGHFDVIYGAGRLEVSHGPDEYIDEAAMRRCAAVYAPALKSAHLPADGMRSACPSAFPPSLP